MANLDRFEFGVQDPQEAKVIHITVDNKEVNDGQTYLETTSGEIIEDSLDALMEHYGVIRKVAGEGVID